MYIVWYFNVYFMVFSYEGGAISPTSRAKSFNSSHRSNFCTRRILWKPWRCWRGSWVKAKARELATCGLSAFGRKPPEADRCHCHVSLCWGTVSGLGVGPGSAPFDSFAWGGPIWEVWRCKSCKIAALWNFLSKDGALRRCSGRGFF